MLEGGRSRAISFLDEDLDRAEAFILRELGMNACLLVPLVVAGQPWGLVELYEARMRRYTRDEEVVADFLVRAGVAPDRAVRRRGAPPPPAAALALPQHELVPWWPPRGGGGGGRAGGPRGQQGTRRRERVTPGLTERSAGAGRAGAPRRITT